MDSLVVSTLLIQSLGIVVTVLSLALLSCLPVRRTTRRWVSTEAVAPAALPETAGLQVDDAKLPRAA